MDSRSCCLLSSGIITKKASRNSLKKKKVLRNCLRTLDWFFYKQSFLFKSRILKALFLPLSTPIFQQEQSHSYLFKVAVALVILGTYSHAGQQGPLNDVFSAQHRFLRKANPFGINEKTQFRATLLSQLHFYHLRTGCFFPLSFKDFDLSFGGCLKVIIVVSDLRMMSR